MNKTSIKNRESLLGNDLSQAQNLLNMFENNVVFVKDDYRVFEKVIPSCTVEVVKEITLSKEGYGDTYDTLQIGSELDKEYNGLFEAKELIRVSPKLTSELRVLAVAIAYVESCQ